jgi:hypothetical protein
MAMTAPAPAARAAAGATAIDCHHYFHTSCATFRAPAIALHATGAVSAISTSASASKHNTAQQLPEPFQLPLLLLLLLVVFLLLLLVVVVLLLFPLTCTSSANSSTCPVCILGFGSFLNLSLPVMATTHSERKRAPALLASGWFCGSHTTCHGSNR